MSEYEIPFVALCIREFGKHFGISRRAAYDYLPNIKGLSFLAEFTTLYTFNQLMRRSAI